MKKILTYALFMTILSLSNVTIMFAKDPQVLGASSVPTVYGIHDPIDTNLGGIEWIFILASFLFVMGLILIVNGKTLKNQLEK